MRGFVRGFISGVALFRKSFGPATSFDNVYLLFALFIRASFIANLSMCKGSKPFDVKLGELWGLDKSEILRFLEFLKREGFNTVLRLVAISGFLIRGCFNAVLRSVSLNFRDSSINNWSHVAFKYAESRCSVGQFS